MIFDANEFATAVLFFNSDGDIAHQMSLAEFQAVLSGYVALEELSNQTVRAVYVEFDNQFHVHRLVFFLLPMSQNGHVSSDWLLPLGDLAATAAKGKNLGAGPIQLACFSQCPVPHLKPHLWDPDLSPSNNQLSLVKRAIQENRLGVAFREHTGESNAPSNIDLMQLEQELSARLRKEYAQEFRDHMAQLLKEQRLRIATTREESRQELFDVKLDYESEINSLKMQLENDTRELEELRRQNAQLLENENNHISKLEAIRGYYEGKLASAEGSQGSLNEELGLALEAELRAKFEAETRELKESLQTREVELLYRNELEVQLHDEVARLREQNQKAMANTGDQLLKNLVESGISLVSFQPGAGHLTIPLNEVSLYLDSPSAYAANQCNVTPEHYEAWLSHYRMPVCENILEDGRQCGENIERIEVPLDFKLGESNCCASCQKKKARAHLKLAGS